MGRILALMNEKGGVGKSTLTFSAAWYLMETGHRVLLIDMDGQNANLTYLAGIDADMSVLTMLDVLTRGKNIRDCIVPVADKDSGVVDLIPASVQMAAIPPQAKISVMKKAVRQAAKNYDYVFLDVNPSPDWRHALSLSVLDDICIVMLADQMSLEANAGIMESIEEVREGANPDLKVAGFVINQFYPRTKMSRTVTDEMLKDHESELFETKIRKAVAFQESARVHKGITEYAPKSMAAEDIRNFTGELISCL